MGGVILPYRLGTAVTSMTLGALHLHTPFNPAPVCLLFHCKHKCCTGDGYISYAQTSTQVTCYPSASSHMRVQPEMQTSTRGESSEVDRKPIAQMDLRTSEIETEQLKGFLCSR